MYIITRIMLHIFNVISIFAQKRVDVFIVILLNCKSDKWSNVKMKTYSSSESVKFQFCWRWETSQLGGIARQNTD